MSFNPVKTLETVFKPVINPLVMKALKPLRDAKKLPGIIIKKIQAVLKGMLGAKETSLRNYVAIGSYYVSKRLLLILALILMAVVYVLFIKPPAIVNKWLNRMPVVVENTPRAQTYTGIANVVDSGKHPRYVGALKDGQYSGSGKLYDANGALVYEGEFDKGLRNGTGAAYDDKGLLVYKGQFAADLYNGAGTLFQSNQKVRYAGEFQNGKFGGAGKLYDDNGALLYEGAFLEGLYHGAGKLFGTNGQLAYEGEFAANEFNGAGKKYDGQGKLQYEGAFKAGRFAGDGTEYDPNGLVKYKGQFAAGAYAGAGELYDDKGTLRFKGTFQNGVLTGTGEAYDEAGKLLYKGRFAGGLYDGIGELYDKDGGLVLKSYFDKGKISLQSFIGIPSKKLEDLLGKPTDVALLGAPLPSDAEGEKPSAADGSAADGSGASAGSAGSGAPSGAAAAEAGAADKFLMNYTDLQASFQVEPSKSNPKEAVVSELTIWGSKPLSVLQPLIETFRDGEKTNAEGFTVLELRAPAPGGVKVNRYYRGDYLYSLSFVAGEKAAHLLEITAIERVQP